MRRLKMWAIGFGLLLASQATAELPARVQGIYARDVGRVEGLTELAGEHFDGVAMLYDEIDAAIEHGGLTETQEAAFEAARDKVDIADDALDGVFTSLGIVNQNLAILNNAADIRAFGTAHGPFNSWCNFATTGLIDTAQFSKDAYDAIGDAYNTE